MIHHTSQVGVLLKGIKGERTALGLPNHIVWGCQPLRASWSEDDCEELVGVCSQEMKEEDDE